MFRPWTTWESAYFTKKIANQDQDFVAWLQPKQGNAYSMFCTQKVFKTVPNGSEGSGIPYAD